MMLKSVHIGIPDTKPFDRVDWFEAFVGNFVLPVLDTKLIDSYWFSRYQDPKKHARFRIKTKDYSLIKPKIDDLIKDLGLTNLADEEKYDGGEFRGRRFVGENARKIDPVARQELIWDFLHASSRLYVDTFSHCDADKYWYREQNHDRGNNIDGDTIESPHHLFCNLTAFAPRVDVLVGLDHQGKLGTELMAGHYRRWMGIPDQQVRASQRVNF
jgi:hypothetical protein